MLDFSSVTDETVAATCEKMRGDSRYCLSPGRRGNVAGLVTAVETLAIDRPNGYLLEKSIGRS